jgi:hypothetical protein
VAKKVHETHISLKHKLTSTYVLTYVVVAVSSESTVGYQYVKTEASKAKEYGIIAIICMTLWFVMLVVIDVPTICQELKLLGKNLRSMLYRCHS